MISRAKSCNLQCMAQLRVPHQSFAHSFYRISSRQATFSTKPTHYSPIPPAKPTTTPPALSSKSLSGLIAQSASPSSTSPTTPSSLLLNPPSTARPPPLDLPTKTSSQSQFSYYYNIGKGYLKFYKNGVKAIYTNFKLCQPIRNRLPSIPLVKAFQQGLLSRGEFVLVERTSSDVRRIPLFALVYLLCGEFTPLVVVAVSGIVPRTLWIPKQVHNAREKIERRRKEAREMWGTIPAHYHKDAILKPEEQAGLLKVARILGLYPQWWDRLPLKPMSMIRARVNSRLELLDTDDYVIDRDGGVAGLDDEEVRNAAETRGLQVLGRDEKALRGELDLWIQARKNHSVIDLVWDEFPFKKLILESVSSD